MSIIKEICSESFLCGESRWIEVLFLYLFQINQKSVRKIYNIMCKRKGEILNEIPSNKKI